MLLKIGMVSLILAGCTTQGWMGLTDWQWMLIFGIFGAACIGLHFFIKYRNRVFREAVNKEVNRKIYYYLRSER